MRSRSLIVMLCVLGISCLQAQSQFDTKKRPQSSSSPRRHAKTIDGRHSHGLLRHAPKGNIKNSIGALARQVKQNKPFKHFRVLKNNEAGLPSFLTTVPNIEGNQRQSRNSDKRLAAYTYLKELNKSIPSLNPAQFDISTIVQEDAQTHVKMQQTYKGYKVYGAEIILHLDDAGYGKVFNGNYVHLAEHNYTPSISVASAIAAAVADVSKKTKYTILPEFYQQLLEYEGPKIEDTLIYQDPSTQEHTLVYLISIHPNTVEHWDYFVDAGTGKIVHALKTTCHADGPKTATATDLNGVPRLLHTYQEGTTYYMLDASRTMFNATDGSGLIQTLDAKGTYGSTFATSNVSSSNNAWTDRTAVSAHYNAGIAYEYYKTTFGRNSIDDKGGSIYSIINVVDEDGSPLDNAYWNGKAMFYGNGALAFKPLAASLDVAGHEMTHGVVQASANLIYQGESGAINESMADIFGCMMDSSDWLLGEDAVKLNYFPSGALRSLSDPHNGGSGLNDGGWQPKHVNEKYNGSQDNGGVHINSGIPNHAFYLYAVALGSRHRASKVFYKALTNYLTKSSKFIDLRLAVVQSAKDLYGENSAAVTEAGKAFDAVGILNGTGTNTNPKLPINPGTEYILCYDTDTFNENGLYILSGDDDFKAVSEKVVYNKPSISDDGKITLFIGEDKRMYAINTDPASNNEIQLIQDDPIWSSVAISKDGTKIAAATYAPDTAIHVFNWETGEEAIFKLYNATFTDSIKASGPEYADGLDWDYSGQYLVYDAFNRIKNTTDLDLEYWDINLIHVWDNTSNDFGSGKIFKLITDLQPGESIGNPAFSKTDPNILAFDYESVDAGMPVYYEIGVNLETNDLGFIAENYSLGWPSFNKTDTKLAFSVAFSNTDYGISAVDLNSDKISSDVAPISAISDAKWGIFYSLGDRDIEVHALDKTIAQNLHVSPNPTHALLHMPEDMDIEEVLIYDKLGKAIHNYTVNSITKTLDVSHLPTDIYILRVKNKQGSYTAKFSRAE